MTGPASASFSCGDEITVPLHYTPQPVIVQKPGEAAVILGYTPSGRAVILRAATPGWAADLASAWQEAVAGAFPEPAKTAVTP